MALSIAQPRWLCLLALLHTSALFGQGITPVVMHTGSGSPLNSQSLSYTSAPGLSALMLGFGFATDEQPQPGIIPDSFTISITGPDGTGYLITADANGTQWAPFVPGALPVSLSSLSWQNSPFLAPTQSFTNVFSFTLGYTLPPNWQGVPLSINFDLFDNQNTLQSLGYYSVVPEPSAGPLLLLGLAFWKRRSRARKITTRSLDQAGIGAHP